MRPYITFFLVLFVSFFSAPLHAQTPPAQPAAADPPLVSAIPLFRAKLPGGTYEVAVKQIIAVTIHEYLVDGALRVTEVNIDTSGSLFARFYFQEENLPAAPGGVGQAAIDKAKALVQKGAAKTGQDAWQKVVKSYPATTHARTVEYRLGSREDLTKLFNAAEESFRMQRQKQVSIEQ